MTAWKHAERRVALALGGRRAGPLGAAVSDIVGVPWSVEVKYCESRTVRTAWITQAKSQGKREGKPWLLVVFGHNDRAPTVTLDFAEFKRIAQDAGLIGIIDITPTEGATMDVETETTTTTTVEPEPQPVPAPPDPDPTEPDTDDDQDDEDR